MKINSQITFFIELAKIHAIMNRRFDSGLGGLGFNEFVILYHLSQVEDNKMRRIDLAEKIGLTASGVTRILLPMEKVGFIKKEINKHDARSSLVMIAPGGKQKFEEGLERAEMIIEDTLSFQSKGERKDLITIFSRLSKGIK